jgi:regulatory protein
MSKHPPVTEADFCQKLEYYCAYQERCHKEVEEKLRSLGAVPAMRDKVISHLITNNYLNETRFTEVFNLGKFRIKKWGKNRIQQELKRRGISDWNIRHALHQIPSEDYHATFEDLVTQLQQKYEGVSSPQLKKKKIHDALLYRGWETTLIFDALREV